MSTSSVVRRVLRNASSMANRGVEAWKRSFGGNRAMARMRRGFKRAASSARRRLDKLLLEEEEKA